MILNDQFLDFGKDVAASLHHDKGHRAICSLFPTEVRLTMIFWLRQELKESKCLFVRSSGPSLSRALNLHLLVSDSSG